MGPFAMLTFMSDYFAAIYGPLATDDVVLLVDSSTKDRLVYLVGGNLDLGFTDDATFFNFNSAATSFNPIPLPAGEQLWAKSGSSSNFVEVFVTKSPSSVSLCG